MTKQNFDAFLNSIENCLTLKYTYSIHPNRPTDYVDLLYKTN